MTLPTSIERAVIAATAFFALALMAIAETRFDGGFAFIWPASAVLVAYLSTTPRRFWTAGIVATGVAAFLVTGFFGLGWRAAMPLSIANLGEAVTAAVLLRHYRDFTSRSESLRWLLGYVLACGTVGTIGAAVIAGATLTLIAGTPFLSAFLHWYSGHALGLLTFTPLFVFAARGELSSRLGELSREQLLGLAGLVSIVLAVSVGVFWQSSFPLLFLPLLPIILATFYAGRLGAAISLVVLAGCGAYATLRGVGPIALMAGSPGERITFLQFYLAATVLTVLPVAADLARRRKLVRDLQLSEARYRALADHSTDIIMNLDNDGRIRFVSPAIRRLAGHAPEALIGTQCLKLITPEYRAQVRDAHIAALRAPGQSIRVEYLGYLADGETRWFETHTRAVLDDAGIVDGAVSVLRDISERKIAEADLIDATRRDPLTGVLNRRGFMAELDEAIASATPGCVAIFDIDHFKGVNDNFGHGVGDQVIQRFAAIAQAHLRDCDDLGRIGGEEFAVVLRDVSDAEAHAICERLRDAISRAPCELDNICLRITVSGGIAELGPDLAADILNRADMALYRAKSNGRNRVCLAA
jgi:diguanylate cyclase (GGDEF)-like protein/PAS domain S-box-containing protein